MAILWKQRELVKELDILSKVNKNPKKAAELKKLEKVPARLAMQYTIQRALEALHWLKEVQFEFQKRHAQGKDCSQLQNRKRILTDAIAMYVSILVEKRGPGHSLIKSFETHDFIKQFALQQIVEDCRKNRHNRSAHESKSYGHFISSNAILESDLETWLTEALSFICVIGKPR